MLLSYLNEFYPGLEVWSLTDILYDCDSFRVQWGNTTDIPFSDWIEMTFSVGQESKDEVKVPFLRCHQQSHPWFQWYQDTCSEPQQHNYNNNCLYSFNLSNYKFQCYTDLHQFNSKIKWKNSYRSWGKRPWFSILTRKIAYMNCKTKVSFLKDKRMFQSDGIDMPEGMHCPETTVYLLSVIPTTTFRFARTWC